MVLGGSLRAGMRVLMMSDVDLRPHTLLKRGEKGTVKETEVDALGVYAVNVRMDKEHKGLRDWDNCAYLVAPEIEAVAAIKRPPLAKRLTALAAGVSGAAIIMWLKVVVAGAAFAPAGRAAGAVALQWLGLGSLMVL